MPKPEPPLINYSDAYRTLWKNCSADQQQQVSKAVMAMFRAQNVGEEEHAEEDMDIARTALVELMLNCDDLTEDNFPDFLEGITKNGGGCLMAAMDMVKNRMTLSLLNGTL